MYNKKESDVYVRAERWCIVEVVVIYDYDARDEDELTLRVNDIIKDVSVQDGGWWTGVLHGRRGFFPDNFVKAVQEIKNGKSSETLEISDARQNSCVTTGSNFKPFRVMVLYAYTAVHPDELSLSVGDCIDVFSEVRGWKRCGRQGIGMVLVATSYFGRPIKQEDRNIVTKIEWKNDEDGWWKGTLQGKTGVFPSNFVKVVNVENTTTSFDSNNARDMWNSVAHQTDAAVLSPKVNNHQASLLVNSSAKRLGQTQNGTQHKKVRLDRARVVYSYVAENDDELTLTVGDTISVLQTSLEDAGWWKGELNGKIGVFPDNFVELLPAVSCNDKASDVTSKKLERPPPPDPSKLVAPNKVAATTTDSSPSCKIQMKTVDQKLIGLTDDHKADAVKSGHHTENTGASRLRQMQSEQDSEAGVFAEDSHDHRPKRAVKPPPPSKVLTPELKDQQPPLPPKSPISRDISFSLKAASGTSRPAQGVISKDLSTSAPASQKPQIASCDQRLELDINAGSLPFQDIVVQLRQEIDRLKEALTQFKSRSDKGIQQLQAEIDEEKLARQALQDEVTQLKCIVSARLGLM